MYYVLTYDGFSETEALPLPRPELPQEMEFHHGVLVPKPLRDAQLHWRNVEALRRLAFVVEGRTR